MKISTDDTVYLRQIAFGNEAQRTKECNDFVIGQSVDDMLAVFSCKRSIIYHELNRKCGFCNGN